MRIAPDLTVEPIRTYYERRALGYQFVRQILDSVCSLKSIHRLTDAGPVMRPLDEELEEMTALMLGAATTVGEELGMAAAAEPEAGRFRAWAKNPDIAEDVRMMVPVFFDRGRSMTKVWAILGWATRLLRVSYVAPPSVCVLEGGPRVEFGAARRRIAYPSLPRCTCRACSTATSSARTATATRRAVAFSSIYRLDPSGWPVAAILPLDNVGAM